MIVPTNRRFEAGNAFSVRAGLDFVGPMLHFVQPVPDFVSPVLHSVKPILRSVENLLDSVFALLGFVGSLLGIVSVSHGCVGALPSPVSPFAYSDALVLFSVGPLHDFVAGALDSVASVLRTARAHGWSVVSTHSSVVTRPYSVLPHAFPDELPRQIVRPLLCSVGATRLTDAPRA
jgi:hypothetical protein